MKSFQVVLEKIFMNNFILSEEIISAFPKLLGNIAGVEVFLQQASIGTVSQQIFSTS
jgi:hypothetical protein